MPALQISFLNVILHDLVFLMNAYTKSSSTEDKVAVRI